MAETVKEYYSKIACKNGPPTVGGCKTDSKTGCNTGCNTAYTASSLDCPLKSPFPAYISEIVNEIHPDVLASYYGCGLPIPEALEGCHVLDLGSGAGRDCFILSKLVGKNGRVVGLDMTQEMVDKASKYIDYHADKFGYKNVEFRLGKIEEMGDYFPYGTFDVIISNCVICLTTDKPKVFEMAHKILKPGGEMYFSDGYALKEVPEKFRNWDLAYNECFGGALVWNEFLRLCHKFRFLGPYVVQSYPYRSTIPELIEATKDLEFVARTVRLFKPPGEEVLAESQITYTGEILGNEKEWVFDIDHKFKAKEPLEVSPNTGACIMGSRYAKYFVE